MGTVLPVINAEELLASLPDQPHRSKLEPYSELIFGLRRKRWTYQRIAYYLSAEFGIVAARNTIHDFVRVRRSQRVKMKMHPNASTPRRIETAGSNAKAKFAFDPERPLTLMEG